MSLIQPRNNEVYESLSFGDPRVCLVATNRESDAKVAIVKSYDNTKGFVTADNQYVTCVRLIKSAKELDDVAVDILADDMKKRLDKKRGEGRRGWHICSEEEGERVLPTKRAFSAQRHRRGNHQIEPILGLREGSKNIGV